MKKVSILIILILLTSLTSFADIVVQYRCGEPSLISTQIKPHINIVNNEPYDIDLSTLTVRYYYTKEGIVPEEINVDFAFIGGVNVTGTIHEGFIEIGFTQDAPPLKAESETGDIFIRLNKTDWSVYNQEDDWSFDPLIEGYKDERHLPLYEKGTQIWGYFGPDSTTTPTPSPSPEPEGYVINVRCNGMEKTTLKYYGDYEGEQETPFTIGPYTEPFSVWFEPTELDIPGNEESAAGYFYRGYYGGAELDFSPSYPHEGPFYTINFTETYHARDFNICYREYGAPTPAPSPVTTGSPYLYIRITDEVTYHAIEGVAIDIYIEDNPEPVTLTTGEYGSVNANLLAYDPVCNFLIKINHPGYHPYEQLYIYDRLTSYPLYLELYPLSEATPDPTPTETPRPIITPDPEIHQTWTSFTAWDPVIQLYHYNESYAIVTQTIYNTTIRAVDWGVPEISGTTITVDAKLLQNMDVSPRLKNNYSHEYHLGILTENQTYTFVFKADSHIIKEIPFTVEPSPVASPFPGAITNYNPTTSISIETIGEITYAKVNYLLFEKEDILHVITPTYPMGGPVTAAGNVYSAQPEILRYVGSEDLVSGELIRHYSVTYTLGPLAPDTYRFKSFTTTKEFTIEWGPTPSPTPVHEATYLISGFVDKIPGITLTLTGDDRPLTITPRSDGYYCFDHVSPGKEYTVTLNFEARAPKVSILVPPDLTSVTGNVKIEAEITSDVCIYLFDPPRRTYSGLLCNQEHQNFTAIAASDCCMLITQVDYFITGGSGQLTLFSDTTQSICSHTYNHEWDTSRSPDWATTITVVATDEAGKTGMDMISIFNDEFPTPSPTPGSIDNPGSIWFKPMNSNVHKNTSFTTDLRANSGTQTIGAYGIGITFVPEIIRPDVTIGSEGVEPGADGFIAAANSANPGELFISGFDTAGTGPGSDLQLVIIHWTALEEGSSYLYLDVDKFVDIETKDIGDFQGISGSVHVLPAVLLGDVNNDSSVDIVDALVVAQYFVGLTPSPFNPAAADVNCDSSISIVDALVIAQYFVGLIDEFCQEHVSSLKIIPR
ncbi:MAG: hypothetical protein JXJ04_26275 [Spirochaetales bacterium]|nr:hypothetical protein [Spirochaetales bacterium]